MTSSPPGIPSLDQVTIALGIAPHHVQAFDPEHPDFDAQRPLLVLPPQFEAARPLLRRRYPPSTAARVLAGEAAREVVVREVAVAALPLDAAAWLLPALPPQEDRRALKGLRGTMERLFGPDGCPWDREQTHETLRRFLLEETYELVDAIDRGDMPGLREEVGDVLAHMFMQTAIAQQDGAFTLEDAVEYATEKFVRRHPHVFGDEETDTPDALLAKWEQIKARERADRGEDEAPEGALDSVPAAAPSLQRAQALFRRAARAGLAPPAEDARKELRDALDRPALDDGARAGDTLDGTRGPLALASLARLLQDADVDAEEALREATARFTRAFQALETTSREAGVPLAELPPERHAAVWAALRG